MSTAEGLPAPRADSANLWQKLDGYHQAWYPVAVSSELAKGERKGMDYCDGKIVLYRGEDGLARATSARCPHLGASLAVGKVIGNELQCGFHHWQFGSGGRCTLIPSGDKIPKGARILAFPVIEKYGLIWVFFGHKPLFDLPSYPGEEADYIYKAIRVPTGMLNCEPWMFGANIVDFQHIQTLHGMPSFHPEVTWHEFGPEWTGIMARDDIGRITNNIRMWGVSSVLSVITNADCVLYYLSGQAPLGREGTGTLMSVGTLRGEGAEERIDNLLNLQVTLVSEDIPVLTTIEPGPSVLSASDRDLVKFIRYARAYPRAHGGTRGRCPPRQSRLNRSLYLYRPTQFRAEMRCGPYSK